VGGDPGSPAEPPGRRLTARDLNRATLARQLLLARAAIDPVTAIGRVVALQAQEPASPYIALWTRLAGFDPDRLDAVITARRVVKATLMRMTLHMVTAADYPAFWTAHAPTFRRTRVPHLGLDALGVESAEVDRLVEAALTHATEPRSNAEMTAYLSALGGPLGTRDWWWAIRGMTPFVHAAGHTPVRPAWSYGPRPAHVAARSWLPPGDRNLAIDPDAALDTLVRRYLGGFGPATVGDVAQFTRLERSRVRASVARLEPTLRVLVDAAGRELLDVPDGVLPGEDAHAPARFLPMWDSVLLAYEDRARLIPPAYRAAVIRSNGDVLPTFLVDGLVAGVWRAELVGGRTEIIYSPFGQLPRDVRAELDDEAETLARFVEPHEPEVYRRYRRWWADIARVTDLAPT